MDKVHLVHLVFSFVIFFILCLVTNTGVVDAEGGGTASFGILEACPDQELAILGSPAEPEQGTTITKLLYRNSIFLFLATDFFISFIGQFLANCLVANNFICKVINLTFI